MYTSILLYTNESASFYQPVAVNTLRTTNSPIQSTIQLQLPTATPKTRIKPTYLVNFDLLVDKSYLMCDNQVLEADREIKLIFDKIRLFTTKQTIHLRVRTPSTCRLIAHADTGTTHQVAWL